MEEGYNFSNIEIDNKLESLVNESSKGNYNDIIKYISELTIDSNFLHNKNILIKLRKKLDNNEDSIGIFIVKVFEILHYIRSNQYEHNKYENNKLKKDMEEIKNNYYKYIINYLDNYSSSSIENIIGMIFYLIRDKENGDYFMNNIYIENDKYDIKRKALINKTIYNITFPISEIEKFIILKKFIKLSNKDQYLLDKNINYLEKNLISYYENILESFYYSLKLLKEEVGEVEDIKVQQRQKIIDNLNDENSSNEFILENLNIYIKNYKKLSTNGKNIINSMLVLILIYFYSFKTINKGKKNIYKEELNKYNNELSNIKNFIENLNISNLEDYSNNEVTYIKKLLELLSNNNTGINSFIYGDKSILETLKYLIEINKDNNVKAGEIQWFYIDELRDKLSYINKI